MKSKLLFIALIGIIFNLFVCNVSANEQTYYTNNKGVSFSKEEYDFISEFYFVGYQDYMSEEDYLNFTNSNIMNGDIKIVSSETPKQTRESVYETSMKILKVSSSCSTNCVIVTTLSWKSNPVVRSYDHIGAYFNSTSLVESPNTKLLFGTNTIFPTYTVSNSNGIADAIKLPSGNSTMNIIQQYSVRRSGSINVSYQHARKSITLANSKRFKFSYNGYGGVFNYEAAVTNYYDAMRGLTLNLV